MALPKFITQEIKNLVGASEEDKVNWYAEQLDSGLSDAEIRARVNEVLGTSYSGYEPDWQYLKKQAAEPLTPEIAKDLMQRSMTTGVGTADFDKYGGYNAVAAMYNANKGSYNLADQTLEQLQSAANQIADTGIGNKAVLDLVKPTVQQQNQQQPFKPVVGGTGVAISGESGLREGYTDYVQDYLQRMSALLARRNVDPTTNEPTYTGPQFGGTGAGGYGTETAQTLKDLQARRDAMMGLGEDKSSMFTPFKYSFAPKSAAAGGIMSLIEGYQTGGNVSGGSTGNMQGSQVVSSTFDNPDSFSPTTYTSGYTAPDTYQAGTITSGYTAPTAYAAPTTGITTGSFDPAAISRFTNSFTSGVVDPQVREAKRQAEIQRMANAAKFTQAGAFGGTGRILAENEIGRNLATQIGDIYGKGQKEAYDAALRAFEAEEGRKLTAGVETEKARQEAGRQGLTGAEAAARLGLQAQTATEQAKQIAAQQGLTAAETAARFGLDASKMTEQSKQFGAQLGLQTAQSEAQYQQLARDLQQRAEEAAARGDQFAANLALQQLAEANRAAEATRQFEYTQARDTYLDPFRELGYANQLLSGLPIKAGDTGISPLAEALAGGAGGASLVNSIIGNPTYLADLKKALGIPPG